MIRLKHLRLRSFTASRAFGADIRFEPGLNIVQAPNTSGKSTCLQAVVYALGLERSLGPQLSVPLPYAMRERIHEFREDPYETVLESYVELEVENGAGEVVVLHRDVTGGKDTRLIQTWRGSSLSTGSPRAEQRDYFALDSGSATNEGGFHAFLAAFLGWDLPVVARYDGTECPLYLEAIFPMLFVEQKRGWSTIQGPFPTFLRIQDPARRVMEFLLNLDTARNRRRRAELRLEYRSRSDGGLIAGSCWMTAPPRSAASAGSRRTQAPSSRPPRRSTCSCTTAANGRDFPKSRRPWPTG